MKSSSANKTTKAPLKVPSVLPSKKRSDTEKTTDCSSSEKAVASTKSSTRVSSTTVVAKTRKNACSPTKKVAPPSTTTIARKIVGTRSCVTKRKTEAVKIPTETNGNPPFEFTSEWCRSLLLDVNIDYSIPLSNVKHPNHNFIKSIDESKIKEMECSPLHTIVSGMKFSLPPCDEFGIQFDGQYGTGHDINITLDSEKFSIFSWTMILRVFIDEKSSCIFSFGPWYRWFVLTHSTVQLNQGNTFLGKVNGLKTNQWNEICISFNFDQEKNSIDDCKVENEIKGKKCILISFNGVENNFGLPSGSSLKVPEDKNTLNNEKCIGFMNMSNGCTLRGTISSIIILNKPCPSFNEMKGLSSTLLKRHFKPMVVPKLLDQIEMPKSIPKEAVAINGATHFKNTIEKYEMIVFFFFKSDSMYKLRHFVFPFINYFAEIVSKGIFGIKFGKIDTSYGNYDLEHSLEWKNECFLFFKNGVENYRFVVEKSTTIEELKKKFAEFENQVSIDTQVKTETNEEEIEMKNSLSLNEQAPIRKSTKPIPSAQKTKVDLCKPKEWLESVSSDININYDIGIENPSHPNHDLYIKQKVLSTVIEQRRSSISKSTTNEKAICDEWGIQFDGKYGNVDAQVEMKSAYFSKMAWSLFMRVYVHSNSENIFTFGPSFRWCVLTPRNLGLSNQQYLYSIEGIRYDDWNEIFISFNVDLPKSPNDICKINNVIKEKKEILLIFNDKKNSIPIESFTFPERLNPFEDNSLGFTNFGSGTCLRGIVSSLVVLSKPCKDIDELERVGTFLLQNHVKYINDPVFVDYQKLWEDKKPSQKENNDKTIDLIKENQFEQIISKYPLVVLDFYAKWCGPCMLLAPSMAALSIEYPAVKIVKVDVEKFSSLAQVHKVRVMPTIVYYYKKKEVKRQEGASKGSIDANISILLDKMSSKDKELAFSLIR